MTRSSQLTGWLPCLAFLALAGCGYIGSWWPTYRFRLTVNVDTPAGLRSGSTVIEVHTTQQGSWNFDSPGVVNPVGFGEAVAVDLPNGQTLFAVSPSKWGQLLFYTYDDSMPRPETPIDEYTETQRARHYPGALIVPARIGVTAEDPGIRVYPTLARFRDISNPATIEEVAYDNLAASFGPGYSLRNMTVQVTYDPITTGIIKRLPWLAEFGNRGVTLDGVHHVTFTGYPLSSNLGASAFQHLN